MLLTRSFAERALEEAHGANPGPWADHSRYVAHPYTVARWESVLNSRQHFERIMGRSVYELLPGVVENSFR